MANDPKINPATGKPWTTQELLDRMLQLEQEKAEAIAKNTRDITMKVSEAKGAISIYGINAKYPISIYRDSVDRLFKYWDSPVPKKLADFITKHDALLTFKTDGKEVLANKLILRKASTSPEVSHEKPSTATK